MTTIRRAMTITAAGALLFAACGGDDDGGSSADLSAADAEFASAIETEMTEDDEEMAEVFDVGCLGEGIVVALGGAENIEAKYGMTADDVGGIEDMDLEPADAEAVAAAYVGCGDLLDVFRTQFEEEGLPGDQVDCLLEDLSSDDVETALAEELSGRDGMEELIFASVFARVEECGVQL